MLNFPSNNGVIPAIPRRHPNIKKVDLVVVVDFLWPFHFIPSDMTLLDTVASNPIQHPRLKKFLRLTLSSATGRAGVPPHGNGHRLLGDIVEVDEGLLQLHAVDGLSGLASVLEADAEVRAPSAGALRVLDLLGGVTDL